jgi:gluconolactonase
MGAGWTTVASQLAAPEGPTIVTDDLVLSVCSLDRDPGWPTRGGDIVVTSLAAPGRSRKVFSTSVDGVKGIPAGLAFGPDGALYVADEGHRAMLRVDADLNVSTFISDHQGQPINGPNDLSFDASGNLYFTDPWTSSATNPIGAVYGYAWASEKLYRIDEGLAFPNGIVARDGYLYVAETFTNTIWRYRIVGPGQATDRQVFCRLPTLDGAAVQGPDGMAFDASGRLYVAHLGSGQVHVFDPEGSALPPIAVGGASPTNVCFAGQALDRLVVSVDDVGELEVIDLGVEGDRLQACPTRRPDHPWARALKALLEDEDGSTASDPRRSLPDRGVTS